MGDKKRLLNFLIRAFGMAYCDDCLSKELSLPPEQVQELTSTFAEEGACKRYDGPCVTCGSMKVVTRRRLSAFAC